MAMQRTLKRALRFAGVGLHSGRPAHVEVRPSPAGSGVVFHAGDASNAGVSATIDNVERASSQLCTRLASRCRAKPASVSVSTVEHLLAALAAARVTNASVIVTSSGQEGKGAVEVPILDGSSAEFMRGIQDAGVETLDGETLGYVKIVRPVQVLQCDKAAWFLPRPEALGGAANASDAPVLDLSIHVNFEHKGLGLRSCRFTLGADAETNASAFLREIAPARTFTFEDEVEWMRAHGLALGGSLDNAVVFSKASAVAVDDAAVAALDRVKVLNKEGLRFSDEWARHKMLDCIGDLSLAGRPLHGYFFATSPGHALTHELLRDLYSDKRNYEICE